MYRRIVNVNVNTTFCHNLLSCFFCFFLVLLEIYTNKYIYIQKTDRASEFVLRMFRQTQLPYDRGVVDPIKHVALQKYHDNMEKNVSLNNCNLRVKC